MAKEKQKYKVGDIFSIEILPGEYAFGRVLFDVFDQGLKEGFINQASHLYFGVDSTILVEIFRQTSNENKFEIDYLNDKLIPGIFTDLAAIKLFRWKIIDHAEVLPNDIEFPQFLTHVGAFNGKYTVGEISFEIEISHEEVQAIDIFRSNFSPRWIPQLIVCKLGRENEIEISPDILKKCNLGNSDLRYSEHKEKIYSLLPDEYKKPYYEMAKEKGFDLMRFY